MTPHERTPIAADPRPEEHLAVDLAGVVTQLMRRMRAASSQGALTPSQRAVLSRLSNDGPATTAALARAELVRPQSMRMILAALEEQELVERAPHPTDGRQVVFSSTERGRQAITSVRQAKQSWLLDAIDTRLDAEERRTLAEATDLLKRLVQE
ncbi:MarR family winged helix-turn-helix transcriptional regulator [Streptomyces sp. 5-10]|uniref:MarR family winged helix-turn-helix transcriptional regulator n=1 Tax=Streptomyces sp. 5-10 TaxID=878925 RepID=UPI00168A813B|nr:MarR family transcriptional regulator [Streptomyces sp. 5-10]MBD3008555.1 MarR family transcriptional regulator [Streptomyces sp. 5-10]